MNATATSVRLRNHPHTCELYIDGFVGAPQWEHPAPGETSHTSSEKILAAIRQLPSAGSRNLTVHIRSLGGSVADAVVIYEALRELDATVETRCYGYVASAATIIAQAASPGKRFVSENALYLIHRSLAETGGNRNDLGRTAQLLEKTDQTIAGIYASQSGKTPQHFLQLMSLEDGNGQWLTARQAVEAGLADQVLRVRSAEKVKQIFHRRKLPQNVPYPPLPVQNLPDALRPGLEKGLRWLTKATSRKKTVGAGTQRVHPWRPENDSPPAHRPLHSPPQEEALPTLLEPREDPPFRLTEAGPNERSYHEDALWMAGRE